MSFIQNSEAYHSRKQEAAKFKPSANVFDHNFLFDSDDLSYLMSHFQEEQTAVAILAQMGGVEGIAYALRTDMSMGLGEDEVGKDGEGDEEAFEFRRTKFGTNKVTEKPPTPFWAFCLDELEDPMLRVLIIAGIVSIIVGAIDDGLKGAGEGIAIMIAVVVVVLVGGFNNFQKEKQFRALEAQSKLKKSVVKRADNDKNLDSDEVVVGDLVILKAGYTIPADGIFVLGSEDLKATEAAMTGESKELKKNRFHPLLMKGTNIVSGEGMMVAVAVGDGTEWGRLMAKLKDERDATPLQDKLEVLSKQIGLGGIAVAILLFLILLIRWIIAGADHAEEILDFFIVAVTIVVVAVPEGLPLAVTISLAYSMKKMLSDNNFVRHLQACETMGNATTICSDKTGTLTTNKMAVKRSHLFGKTPFPTKSGDEATKRTLSAKAYDRITQAVCKNTVSFKDTVKTQEEREAIDLGKMKHPLTGGNQTDCAMLQWAIDLGADDFRQIREQNPIQKAFPFDSKLKRSSVLVRERKGDNSEWVIFVKGAAEQVLELCTKTMNADGEVEEYSQDDKGLVVEAMDDMACNGLRCLGLCYRVYSMDQIAWKSKDSFTLEDSAAEELFEDMVWIGCTGIQDPVRPEVPKAVETCHKAGIVVRMVTGDHLETAKHIARDCNILCRDHHISMTGAQFRLLSDEDKRRELPLLRVLARSKPADKEALVTWYKEVNGDTVAVTGDGANDALALKKADVGLSMGIQGTDVAKEASDIIIMDDNFASIEKTVMWGRSVYDNIRKFVQFQLTVNVTALTLSLFCAFFEGLENPLTAVQLLWVNLIMDTMAALALATETPTEKLLDRHPFQKDSHIISQILWRFVFGHSIYQLTVLLLILFLGEDWLDLEEQSAKDEEEFDRKETLLTIVFNTFVWFQIFNEINARRVNNEKNVFEGIFKNSIFWGVIIVTIGAQALLVQFGGTFVHTVGLDAVQWFFCIGFGAGELIWHQLVIMVPVNIYDGIKFIDVMGDGKTEQPESPGVFDLCCKNKSGQEQ